TLRHPAHDPVLEAAETRVGVRLGRRTTAATLLRLMKHHRKLVTDASDDSSRPGRDRRRLYRSLAIELVPVGADRNHEHVHREKGFRYQVSAGIRIARYLRHACYLTPDTSPKPSDRRASTGDQVHEEQNHRDHEQHVNDAAGDVEREPEHPEQQ